MFYVRYLKKPINIVFSLLVFVLGVLAIVFCFTNDLFACEWIKGANNLKITNLKFFDVFTGNDTTFTLQGIIEFSDRMALNQTNSSLISHLIITSDMVNGANTIKTLSIVLIVLYGIFAICQFFDFRVYSNFVISLTSFILLISMKDVAFSTLLTPNFINLTTKMFDVVKCFWCISFIVSFIQILYNLFVKFFAKAEI